MQSALDAVVQAVLLSNSQGGKTKAAANTAGGDTTFKVSEGTNLTGTTAASIVDESSAPAKTPSSVAALTKAPSNINITADTPLFTATQLASALQSVLQAARSASNSSAPCSAPFSASQAQGTVSDSTVIVASNSSAPPVNETFTPIPPTRPSDNVSRSH